MFHAFHRHWNVTLCNASNEGGLPPAYYALPERQPRGPVPDVLTLRLSCGEDESTGNVPTLAVAEAPPRARVVQTYGRSVYVRRTDRVTVRHRHGEIVAVIEVVSPGNKGSMNELRALFEKVADLILQGVHVLVIDLSPPTKRDPQGVQMAIWDEIQGDDYTPPSDKLLKVAAYSAWEVKTAYVEPFGVGDESPEMPLFLEPEIYVPMRLEDHYQTAWRLFPAVLKGLLEPVDAREDHSEGP